jgi:hypothetical protein
MSGLKVTAHSPPTTIPTPVRTASGRGLQVGFFIYYVTLYFLRTCLSTELLKREAH